MLPPNTLTGPRQGESYKRDQMAYAAQAGALSSARAGHHWQVPPTPPLSTSPDSAESYSEEAYFPPVQGACASYAQLHNAANARKSQQNGHYVPSPLTPAPSVTSPTVTTTPASFQLLRSTRAPTPNNGSSQAQMRIDNTPTEYILTAAIGPGYDSSCITIAARKGNILDIVADRWDKEKDCTYSLSASYGHVLIIGVSINYTPRPP